MIKGILPTIDNILLHYTKWKLSTLNPLAPADVLRQLIFKVEHLERRNRK